jgi:hypothetical protein
LSPLVEVFGGYLAGFLVKGAVTEMTSRSAHLVPYTYLFTDEDLEATLDAAYGRRHSGQQQDTRPDQPLRYEDQLRVIGRMIDSEEWHEVAIVEVPSGIRIKAFVRPKLSVTTIHEVIDILISPDEITQQPTSFRASRNPIRDLRTSWKRVADA